MENNDDLRLIVLDNIEELGNNVNEHLKDNPYMNILWNKSGYVVPENEFKRTM